MSLRCTLWHEINLSKAGDDESKLDDAHSLGSGAGEGYEPISDDELDEILAGDAEKREDQQDEEKMPGNHLQEWLNIKIIWFMIWRYFLFPFKLFKLMKGS